MNDLLKKLNTLIQAGIHDVLDEAQKTAKEPLKHIPRSRLGGAIASEVDQLRRKVNEALSYEEELVARAEELRNDVATLDRQADEEVAAGNDAQARYLLDRMNRAKQRLEMTEADLKTHRLATQELILRVNELDAAISDARHAEQQQQQQQDESSDQEHTIPVTVEQDNTPAPKTSQDVVEEMRVFSEQSGRVLSDVLREAREKINHMDAMISSQTDAEAGQSVQGQVEEALEKEVLDDDIAARRARLARPPKPKDTGETSE